MMQTKLRLLIAVGAMSLIGVAGSATVANATATATATIEDCQYLVTAAGNGLPTYFFNVSNGTLTPNGTLHTGQQLDLRTPGPEKTDPNGDTMFVEFPGQATHTWAPVTSSTGVTLASEIPFTCAIDSGTQ